MTLGRKMYLELPAPGPADHQADRERLLAALPGAGLSLEAMRELYPTLHRANYRVTVTLSPTDTGWEVVRVEPGDTTGRLYGLALDLGSTTLELTLLDLNTGTVLARAQGGNSQAVVGTDILTRITYAKDDTAHLAELQTMAAGDINALTAQCCREAGVQPEEVAALTVGGNTTMIHLLQGCDPWLVFQNPYTPGFFDPGVRRAAELGLDLRCNVVCMPAVANYVGGDITGGLLLTDLDTRPDPALFLDIGTNGEIALGCRDFLLVGAGAAGPALEGGVSATGMRAQRGAVCNVRIAGGQIRCRTIDDAPPVGICGSGILDLVAQGYREGWIAGNGSLNPEASPQIRMVPRVSGEGQVPAIAYAQGPKGPLYFTQEDIKTLIHCKAAAFTMAATLLDACGLGPENLGAVYLAGGFGEHLDLESAITVGMYPDLPRERFHILGNSSLKGAQHLLLDRACLDRVREFAARAEYVQFGEMEKFLENMVAAEFIPHTNAGLFPSVTHK